MYNKLFILLSLFLFSYLVFFGQNLPNKQNVSVFAPQDLKIDGKNLEWGTMKANNRATSIFYTMANDKDNLYLIMQVKDIDALYKIIAVGIRITIFPDILKNENKGITINYPFFEMGNKPYIDLKNAPKLSAPSATIDSFIVSINNKINKSEKFLKIIGAPGIDTIISIYNEEGFKARNAFDNKMIYTCEIAVPLKYINVTPEGTTKFKYHVALPGTTSKDYGITKQVGADGIPVFSSASGAAIPSKEHLAATTTTTDFWAEYKLSKKP